MNVVDLFTEVGSDKILTPYNKSIIFNEDCIDDYVDSLIMEDDDVNVSYTFTNKKRGNVKYLRRADFDKCCDRYNAAIGDGGDVRNKFLDKAIKFEGEFVYFNGEIVTE